MLAERALLWKQEYIQQGISIGETKGLAMALQDYLESRFGVLSQEILSGITANSDPQSLRELTRTAYRADSFDVFLQELKKYLKN